MHTNKHTCWLQVYCRAREIYFLLGDSLLSSPPTPQVALVLCSPPLPNLTGPLPTPPK